jgi:hypothetical protein
MPHRPNRSKKKAGTEYRFKIDAYTPDTMPMGRLAEYMTELAVMLGERGSVHFERIESASTIIVHRIDREATPKVRERVKQIRTGEAPSEALRAYGKTNRMLREDDGTGKLQEGRKGVLINFPGRDEAIEKFPTVRQAGAIDGELTWVGGDPTGHVTLKSEGREISRIYASKAIAKRLGNKLYEHVRLFGRGRWVRDADGLWTLQDFRVDDFEPLEDIPLSAALERLRAIPSEWSNESYGELQEIRRGPNGNVGKRNGGH